MYLRVTAYKEGLDEFLVGHIDHTQKTPHLHKLLSHLAQESRDTNSRNLDTIFSGHSFWAVILRHTVHAKGKKIN